MDPFARNIVRSYPTISAADLQSLGKQAAREYLHHGVPLNEAIVKLATSHAGITVDQVKRIVEFANQSTFQSIFEKQAGDKNVEFNIADPREILRSLDVSARPTPVEIDTDYSMDPTKLSTKREPSDMELIEAFGMTEKFAAAGITKEATLSKEWNPGLSKAPKGSGIKQACAKIGQYDEANPFGELLRTKQQIEKVAEHANDAAIKNEQMTEAALQKVAHEVKQLILDGSNLGEAVHVMSLVGGPAWTKVAMENIIPEMHRHGLDTSGTQAEMIAYEMTKAASPRQANAGHPLVESFAAFVKTAENQGALNIAVQKSESMKAGLENQLAKVSTLGR